MRTNIYRKKIIKLLNKRHLLSIADINHAIPEADYSTIFRNVEQLLKEKAIKRIILDNKSVAYESSLDKHDHFICNDCGKIEEVYIPHNTIKDHKVDDITVRGSCNNCN